MSTYCISDIHGCFSEFMSLLNLIKFAPANDAIYILGDVIDRGNKPLDSLSFIRQSKGIHLLMGNHEQMMLDFFDASDNTWIHNGSGTTRIQLSKLPDSDREETLDYLRKRPYYKTIIVSGRRYFLSHAGLDTTHAIRNQSHDDLLWGRNSFFDDKALKSHICVFGHTPSIYLRGNCDCSIWLDTDYHDKICIDCGCVYGGALAALRLDDGAVFYVKSQGGNSQKYRCNPAHIPTSFF